MPTSAVLDTAIGLVLFFFTVAVVCSAAVESSANLLRKRAKYLLRGLRDLLDGAQPAAGTPTVTGPPAAGVRAATRRVYTAVEQERALYQRALDSSPETTGTGTGTGVGTSDTTRPQEGGLDWTTRVTAHPLVDPFKQSRPEGGKTRNPAYLPAAAFAAALLDEIIADPTRETSIETVRDAVHRLPDSVPFKAALVSLLTTAGNDLATFVGAVEGWYDAKMDQIGGAYRRWAKRWLIVFGIAVAVVLQLDAIAIGRSLYASPPQRELVVASAGNGTLCPAGQTFDATRRCVDGELDRLGAAGLPIGWSAHQRPVGMGAWLLKILGLAVTAIAATLGAPFWFDVLNRLGSLRNAGRPPRSSAS
jgi:hypothetical protein